MDSILSAANKMPRAILPPSLAALTIAAVRLDGGRLEERISSTQRPFRRRWHDDPDTKATHSTSRPDLHWGRDLGALDC
jgi:hypothetical protein